MHIMIFPDREMTSCHSLHVENSKMCQFGSATLCFYGLTLRLKSASNTFPNDTEILKL
jgi:hypothetical protein